MYFNFTLGLMMGARTVFLSHPWKECLVYKEGLLISPQYYLSLHVQSGNYSELVNTKSNVKSNLSLKEFKILYIYLL